MKHTPTAYAPYAPYDIPRRRRKPVALFLLLPVLLFGFLFFGLSYLASPEPDVEVQPGIGQATVGGRDVVLVPYARTGSRGMWQLMTQDLFQVRLAAADPVTGEVLWDTQLSDSLVWEADVLAAGQRLAYLATGSGLAIVDLSDGALLAIGEQVQGLGASFAEARGAYAYDPQTRRVMAMNAAGTILAIPLDTTIATTIDPTAATPWTTSLSVTRSTSTPPAPTTPEAMAGPDRITLSGTPLAALTRTTPDGHTTPVGPATFPGATLVGPELVGEHVLVAHDRSVNDPATVLTAVSLRTGAVSGSVDVGRAPERVLALTGGGTVITTGDAAVVLSADGRLTALPIGAVDFFGSRA